MWVALYKPKDRKNWAHAEMRYFFCRMDRKNFINPQTMHYQFYYLPCETLFQSGDRKTESEMIGWPL